MSKIGRVQSKTVIKYSTETWLSDLQRGECPFNGNPIIWVLVGATDAKKPSRGSRLKPTSCFWCKHVSPLSTWLDYLKKNIRRCCASSENYAAPQVKILSHVKCSITCQIQIGIRTRCQTNVDDSMTIYRISIGRMAVRFLFHFTFIINISLQKIYCTGSGYLLPNINEVEWKHKCHSFYWYSVNGHEVSNFCLIP